MRYIDENRDVEEQFATLIGGVAEAYGHRISETRIKMYARALDHLPIEQVIRACSLAVREHEGAFMPTPAQLIGYVTPSQNDAALLAWNGLVRAASKVGAYASLDVEDGAAAAALRSVFGSWMRFCEAEDGPQLALQRQQWLAAYRQARREGAAPQRLPGLCEATGSYPAEGRDRLWVGRLTAGGSVEVGRDIRAALSAASQPAALPARSDRGLVAKAGAAQAGEGSEARGRGQGHQRKPGKVRRT